MIWALGPSRPFLLSTQGCWPSDLMHWVGRSGEGREAPGSLRGAQVLLSVSASPRPWLSAVFCPQAGPPWVCLPPAHPPALPDALFEQTALAFQNTSQDFGEGVAFLKAHNIFIVLVI